jgi:DNA-directed RNA polymerase specialized sigma24 family protein
MEGPAGDEMLLAGVAGRDTGAFRALYERHAGWLAIRLARRCNDGDLVADAVGDIFVAVWRRPRGFRAEGDVAAWLRGIAIRRLVSRLRAGGGVAAAVFGDAGGRAGSLDLEPGVTGLPGPDGAGKTTLLRLLATALPPSQGKVSVLGPDPEVPAERTGIRRQLGYQPQEAGFPRGFTAFAFVDYIALLKEWTQPAARHAELRRVLDLAGLSGLGAKRIRAMSGGSRCGPCWRSSRGPRSWCCPPTDAVRRAD